MEEKEVEDGREGGKQQCSIRLITLSCSFISTFHDGVTYCSTFLEQEQIQLNHVSLAEGVIKGCWKKSRKFKWIYLLFLNSLFNEKKQLIPLKSVTEWTEIQFKI